MICEVFMKEFLKKINFKTILLFLLFLLIYALPAFFFKVDKEFYASLKKINVPVIVFPIVWSIIYILLSILLVFLVRNYPFKEHKKLYIYYLINYLIQASFTPVFFMGHNLFLGYIIAIATFASTIFLFLEVFPLNKKASLLLVPYLGWGLFASILSILIYIWN